MNISHHPVWGQRSADEARALQNKTFRSFIRDQVFPHCVHYRRKFKSLGITPTDLRDLEDLSKLPFTSKADLAVAVTEGRIRDFLILPDAEKLRSLSLIHI